MVAFTEIHPEFFVVNRCNNDDDDTEDVLSGRACGRKGLRREGQGPSKEVSETEEEQIEKSDRTVHRIMRSMKKLLYKPVSVMDCPRWLANIYWPKSPAKQRIEIPYDKAILLTGLLLAQQIPMHPDVDWKLMKMFFKGCSMQSKSQDLVDEVIRLKTRLFKIGKEPIGTEVTHNPVEYMQLINQIVTSEVFYLKPLSDEERLANLQLERDFLNASLRVKPPPIVNLKIKSSKSAI